MEQTEVIQIILNAYRDGIFPMAEDSNDDSFAFYSPHMRGLLPIQTLHVPQKLAKILRQRHYKVTVDTAFEQIITGCAASTPTRNNTWINIPIRDIFIELHKAGHAHSIEVWNKENILMGGLYGLSIGSVFCGESMVSFEANGSKIALIYLCAILNECDYTVLDTQFINSHLLQFGAFEIPQNEYIDLIKTQSIKDTAFFKKGMVSFDILERYLNKISK